MESPFFYRKVDHDFVEEIRQLVEKGESAILVGARDLGKSYILRGLAGSLEQAGGYFVIEMEFPREPPLISHERIADFVRKAVARASGCKEGHSPDVLGDLLSEVRALCSRKERAVVLLVANVDCLAHHQAQQFLREVRTLVTHHELRVVLSGEENLRDLVTGKDSEFNCAGQYLIQGYAKDKFRDYIGRRYEFGQLTFQDGEAAIDALFEATGGNIFLAKAALWAWLELTACGCAPGESPIEPQAWVAYLGRIPPFEKCDLTIFHHMAQVIKRAANEWPNLQKLLQSGAAPIWQPGPSELELSGLAIRKGQTLHFASPIVGRFARTYYDDCRMGDLYAVQGDWDAALGYYETMPDDRRQRPCGTDDRPHIASVTKALSAVLFTEATRRDDPPPHDSELIERERLKLERVKDLFARGCRLVLGFQEISFWTLRDEWVPLDSGPQTSDDSLPLRALQTVGSTALGWHELKEFESHVGVAILPSIRRDHRDAVVVTSNQKISRERRQLLKDLMSEFAISYHRSIANYGMALRLGAQREHLKTADEIVNAIGDAVRDPVETLRRAGQALLKLDYSRVMFALVDGARSSIIGVLDISDLGENAVELAPATRLPLIGAGEDVDIQVWVAREGKHCTVPNWREQKNPSVQQDLCGRAEMGPFVVLPMFIAGDRVDAQGKPIDQVFGTIHVERKDRMMPSDDDIRDLENFGRLIAAAVLQTERLNALLQTLERDHDAVAIFSRDKKIRFANAAAARRLGIDEGWHDARRAPLLDKKHAEIERVVSEVLESGNRMEHYDKDSNSQNLKREVMECEPLEDWRMQSQDASMQGDSPGGTIGCSLQIRDLIGLSRVLKAVQFVANRAVGRELVIEAVVQYMPLPRCSRARLYLVPPNDPNVLVSTRHQGLPEPYGSKFNEGVYTMERFDPSQWETWVCLTEKKTCVFTWQEGKRGDRFMNKERLEAIVVPEPVFRDGWKEPGFFWVDLPLLAGDRVIGKLTFDIPPDLSPQERELLDTYAELLGPLIEAPQPMQRWITEAAEKAIATAAHNIKTRFGALGGFARRYEEACPNNDEVRKLNGIYQSAIDGTEEIISRIREMFTKIVARRERVDVRQLLEGVIEVAKVAYADPGPPEFTLQCGPDISFNLDKHRVEMMLQEMIENSRGMIEASQKLEMTLSARVETSGSDRNLIIHVEDNGPGVPKPVRQKIFDSFYTSRPHGAPGTGVGLSFVWRVVEAHGGGVHVANPGEPGAIFVIQIPETNAPAK